MRGNQRKAQPGVAGSGLDDRVSGFDIAAFFSFLDHRDTDTIFDGPRGIHEFELQEQATRTRIHMTHLEHGCLPDHVENIGEDFHCTHEGK